MRSRFVLRIITKWFLMLWFYVFFFFYVGEPAFFLIAACRSIYRLKKSIPSVTFFLVTLIDVRREPHEPFFT